MRAAFPVLLLAIGLSFGLSRGARAAVVDGVSIGGIITDYNEQWVTLFSEGNLVVVPRNSIPSNLTIRAGYPVTSYQNAEEAQKARHAAEDAAKHDQKVKSY
jgi:hypothetical protein